MSNKVNETLTKNLKRDYKAPLYVKISDMAHFFRDFTSKFFHFTSKFLTWRTFFATLRHFFSSSFSANADKYDTLKKVKTKTRTSKKGEKMS